MVITEILILPFVVTIQACYLIGPAFILICKIIPGCFRHLLFPPNAPAVHYNYDS